MTQNWFSFATFVARYPIPNTIKGAKDWLSTLNENIHRKLASLPLNDSLSAIYSSLQLRTKAIDSLLIHLFTPIASNRPIALFATGGYGRGELLPHSDVDILVLYGAIDQHTTDELHHFVATLWDIGITPAITLRPLDDKNCAKELSVANSLFESRWLAGDHSLSFLPISWAKNTWSTSCFLSAKLDEATSRHTLAQNNDTLEPNIKTSLGGLRDIHLLQWVFNFYANLPPSSTLDTLYYHRFLTQKERGCLTDALHFFWLIRHHLHTLEQKNSNQLSFWHQKHFAQQFGFGIVTATDVRPAEAFMKTYYRHAMTVATLSDTLCRLLEFQLTQSNITPIDTNFYILSHHNKNYIGLLADTPDTSVLLSLFIAMQKYHCNDIDPRTLRTLLNQNYPISHTNPIHQKLFLDILKEPSCLYERLLILKKVGILQAYIPDFTHIIGLMQYDLFHQHTVDMHTLLVIHQFLRFEKENFAVLSTLYTKLDNKLPLVIAALFHDIAKGQGGEHSKKGARLAKQFCKAHRLPKKDSKLIVWLVRHHLAMSLTAQKKDIFNPIIIDEFASFVSSTHYLDCLYLLTVADMNATNSQLWNNWRADLLKKLYLSTHNRLTEQQHTSNPTKLIHIKKYKSQSTLGTQPKIISLWNNLPDDYFLTQSVSDIIWHTYAILLHKKNNPLVIIKPHQNKALHAFKLFVRMPNQRGVFAQIAVILNTFGFAVLEAQILSDHTNFTINSYLIAKEEIFNAISSNKSKITRSPIPSHHEIRTLINALTRQLDKLDYPLSHTLNYKKQPYNTALQHFQIPTQIYFERTGNHQYLHIVTKNRPALLAIIGILLTKLDVWVHSAKITTLGERAEDVFRISDTAGNILSSDKKNKICQVLLKKLDH